MLCGLRLNRTVLQFCLIPMFEIISISGHFLICLFPFCRVEMICFSISTVYVSYPQQFASENGLLGVDSASFREGHGESSQHSFCPTSGNGSCS